MRIVLLGRNGQVGGELLRSLVPLGDLLALDRSDGDLQDIQKLGAALDRLRPDVIVNAAAYTAVDLAESEPDKARAVNTDAVRFLAEWAKAHDAWLVHYSTDYVFDGSKDGAYTEKDATNPLGVYGVTKRDGEQAVIASGAKHLVFRTSWVYAARGKNFVHTILNHARDKDKLQIVADQFGAPTSAELIADVTAQALSRALRDPSVSGLYHLVAAGRTSWHGFAQYFLDLARRQGVELRVTPENVLPIASADYKTTAQRPKNSCLGTEKLRKTFGIALPDWKIHVQKMMEEVTQ